ncbi:MAG TPA: OmpH family outer membrane protein [Xanthobacteraceae bacterium]|nr:OmpH family outer membrane protein [Xanthobacteraceae bacterium]
MRELLAITGSGARRAIHRAIVVTAALVLCAPAQAAEAALVDLQFVMQNAEASKNLRLQVEKMRSEYQSKAKAEQDEIEKLNQALAREREKISDAEYWKRLRALRQRAANSQIDAQERQERLDAALAAASEKIAAVIVQIVDEVRKERNLAFVLSNSATVGTSTIPDITPEVLKRVNQRLSTVAFDPWK